MSGKVKMPAEIRVDGRFVESDAPQLFAKLALVPSRKRLRRLLLLAEKGVMLEEAYHQGSVAITLAKGSGALMPELGAVAETAPVQTQVKPPLERLDTETLQELDNIELS